MEWNYNPSGYYKNFWCHIQPTQFTRNIINHISSPIGSAVVGSITLLYGVTFCLPFIIDSSLFSFCKVWSVHFFRMDLIHIQTFKSKIHICQKTHTYQKQSRYLLHWLQFLKGMLLNNHYIQFIKSLTLIVFMIWALFSLFILWLQICEVWLF